MAPEDAPDSSNTLELDKGTHKEDDSEMPSRIMPLEEDDEFEEFLAQDWDDSHTDLAHLGTENGKFANNELWEDNWDDDDVEDDFSVQLRNELAKIGSGGTGGNSSALRTGTSEAMQH